MLLGDEEDKEVENTVNEAVRVGKADKILDKDTAGDLTVSEVELSRKHSREGKFISNKKKKTGIEKKIMQGEGIISGTTRVRRHKPARLKSLGVLAVRGLKCRVLSRRFEENIVYDVSSEEGEIEDSSTSKKRM